VDENWRNGLDNIKIAKNVLSKKDLHELKTYMYTNMAFHETYPNERIPRTDGKDFPIYNFLPKNKKPTNLLEKYIVGLMNGQEHHIEYWMRYNDSLNWHIDSDEIIERTPGVKIKATEEYPISTFTFYVDVDEVVGGELQVAPFDKRDFNLLTTENYEPSQGTKVLTIPPENNCVISWNGPISHRVLEQQDGKRLVLVWSLWKEIPQGFRKGLHWKPSTIFPGNNDFTDQGFSTSEDFYVVSVEWPIKEDL